MYSCIGFIKICCCMQKLKTVIFNLLILHFNMLISLKSASVCKKHDLSTCWFYFSTCLFHLNCHWMMKYWSGMIFNLLFSQFSMLISLKLNLSVKMSLLVCWMVFQHVKRFAAVVLNCNKFNQLIYVLIDWFHLSQVKSTDWFENQPVEFRNSLTI